MVGYNTDIRLSWQFAGPYESSCLLIDCISYMLYDKAAIPVWNAFQRVHVLSLVFSMLSVEGRMQTLLYIIIMCEKIRLYFQSIMFPSLSLPSDSLQDWSFDE